MDAAGTLTLSLARSWRPVLNRAVFLSISSVLLPNGLHFLWFQLTRLSPGSPQPSLQRLLACVLFAVQAAFYPNAMWSSLKHTSDRVTPLVDDLQSTRPHTTAQPPTPQAELLASSAAGDAFSLSLGSIHIASSSESKTGKT